MTPTRTREPLLNHLRRLLLTEARTLADEYLEDVKRLSTEGAAAAKRKAEPEEIERIALETARAAALAVAAGEIFCRLADRTKPPEARA